MPTNDRELLTELILAEHSKAQTMRIVRWIGHNADRFALLMELFLGDVYRITQRGAWALRYVGEAAPELLAPWLPRMLARLREPGIHDAVKRNVLNVFEDLNELPEALHGELADICFGLLADPQEAVAIRCAAMTILDRICQLVPELKPELRLLLEEHIEHGTAGFKSRSRKILQKT